MAHSIRSAAWRAAVLADCQIARAQSVPARAVSGLTSRSSVDRLLRDTVQRSVTKALTHYFRLLKNPDHVAAALGMMAAWNLRGIESDLAKIEADCLFVTGKNDRSVPPETSVRAAKHCRGPASGTSMGLVTCCTKKIPYLQPTDRRGTAVTDRLLLLPEDTPYRRALNDEVHARPPDNLEAPVRLSYLVLMGSGSRSDDLAMLSRLIEAPERPSRRQMPITSPLIWVHTGSSGSGIQNFAATHSLRKAWKRSRSPSLRSRLRRGPG